MIIPFTAKQPMTRCLEAIMDFTVVIQQYARDFQWQYINYVP